MLKSEQEVAISPLSLKLNRLLCRLIPRHPGFATTVLACLVAASSPVTAAEVTPPVSSADIGDKMSRTLAQLSRDFGVQGTIPARQFHQRIALSAQQHPYDYTVFGAMDGVVTRISADVVPVERDQEYYMARIETRLPALENNGKKLPVIPGMQAQVDIVTGNKTVLAYITKPVTALKENAFRER